MNSLNPVALDAVEALALFGCRTQRQARILFSTWARREQLTAADVAAIVATFPARRGTTRATVGGGK
jgi:hypothetical protein